MICFSLCNTKYNGKMLLTSSVGFTSTKTNTEQECLSLTPCS